MRNFCFFLPVCRVLSQISPAPLSRGAEQGIAKGDAPFAKGAGTEFPREEYLIPKGRRPLYSVQGTTSLENPVTDTLCRAAVRGAEQGIAKGLCSFAKGAGTAFPRQEYFYPKGRRPLTPFKGHRPLKIPRRGDEKQRGIFSVRRAVQTFYISKILCYTYHAGLKAKCNKMQ